MDSQQISESQTNLSETESKTHFINKTVMGEENKHEGPSALTEQQETSTSSDQVKTEGDNAPKNRHPYENILTNFEPPSDQLCFLEKTEPCKRLSETPLREVTTPEALINLINDLKEEKELGVDVEYSDHGYKAVTCLMQISTKKVDYIIDALALKDHMHLLQDILINRDIVKIFHAAQNDLKWLQQDFRLFVINTFDTQKAMKALNFKKLGLDSLLSEYNVKKDTALQRADFRTRPLPEKYKEYARTDSHFLIHIYHTLRNKLVEAKLLKQVLEECKKDCLVVHEDLEDSYKSVQSDITKMHQRQLVALEKLNEWRHRVAKVVDKNTGYILSKNNMKNMILQLPVDAGAVVSIGKSEFVKRDVEEILQIMLEAKSDKPPPNTFVKSQNFQRKGFKDHNRRNNRFDPYRGNKRRFY